MIVGIMGTESETGRDFSFVSDELDKLKDVPRKFDEELYLKLGASRTVVDYWKESGYKPNYYYLFWLFQEHLTKFDFEERIALRDELIAGVNKESERIGRELELYAKDEDEAYNQFKENDGSYMYFLSDEYDDGSGSTIQASIEYEELIRRIKAEVAQNKEDDFSFEIEYKIVKFPILMSEDGARTVGIDMENNCGEFRFNTEGVLHDITGGLDFKYDGMDAIPLLNPYIFIPHPFKKGDIVKCDDYGEIIYGVLSYAADKDERYGEHPEFHRDGSDFSTTIECVCLNEDENRFIFGHDHICPLYLEYVDLDDLRDEKLRLLLMTASNIMKGKSTSISDLSYCMG